MFGKDWHAFFNPAIAAGIFLLHTRLKGRVKKVFVYSLTDSPLFPAIPRRANASEQWWNTASCWYVEDLLRVFAPSHFSP